MMATVPNLAKAFEPEKNPLAQLSPGQLLMAAASTQPAPEPAPVRKRQGPRANKGKLGPAPTKLGT